ncbi:MAG: ankyrin repeat domain-containing protein [Acidobacteria bacterium]|nr:ankyrin repeat domain-containing protein [Acidobacteriota bacterium]
MHTGNTRPITLPLPVRIVGGLSVLATALLAGRLVWEQTILTWRNGPQMVGFSLVHGSYAPLIFAPIGLLLWIAVLVAVILIALARRRRMARAMWIDLGCSAVVAGVLAVPYGTWQRLFVGHLASGPHAGRFLTAAAGGGDLRLVRALMSHGVRVDATDYYGQTGLHTAASGDHLDVLAFLVEHGVTLDKLDRYGDSALEKAAEQGATQAARFLELQGAHLVRGTAARHEKVVDEMVREAMSK